MDEKYQTSDFGLVVYLSLFYPITEKQKLDEKRVIFYFDQTDDLLAEVEKYYKKETMVDALTFKNQMTIIKSQIFNNY